MTYASAGNRTRVTSMATMHSATRPLIPLIVRTASKAISGPKGDISHGWVDNFCVVGCPNNLTVATKIQELCSLSNLKMFKTCPVAVFKTTIVAQSRERPSIEMSQTNQPLPSNLWDMVAKPGQGILTLRCQTFNARLFHCNAARKRQETTKNKNNIKNYY